MRTGFLIGMIALLICSCSSVKKTSKTSATLTKAVQDSTEYVIQITDPQFDLWYHQNYSPVTDYSKEYYRGQNLVGVVNWNNYYIEGKYCWIIESTIDYRPEIDYSIDLERTLYWYFKYISINYNIRLFSTPPI